MTRHPPIVPVRLKATLAAATVALGACSAIDGPGSGSVDYRSTQAKTKPLDVPPDLTQIARESRYGSQGGVISAAAGPAGAASAVRTSNSVAPVVIGDIRVERLGTQRWLVVPMAPDRLWPIVRGFWAERGFKIAEENAEAGIIETDWAENRAKLPADAIRSTLGRVLGGLFDTGERDRFRTRIERTATGSEIYISHRGLEEVYGDERRESTQWRSRPSDPQLEAEMLSLLMARLAGNDAAPARTAVAAAPEAPTRARTVTGAGAALEVDEPFDRAWRRVGLALDRGGFTVEDRDRAGGLYFVRYVDPKNAGKDEPGFWDKLFSSSNTPRGPLRYRIAVKGSGAKTTVSVLSSTGEPEGGDNAQRIVSQLVTELR